MDYTLVPGPCKEVKKPGIRCPECDIVFSDTPYSDTIPGLCQVGWQVNETANAGWFQVEGQTCDSCGVPIVHLCWTIMYDEKLKKDMQKVRKLVFPLMPRVFVPLEVPKEIKKDFIEASRVLEHSPSASAALSRRCLQNIIRSHYNVTKSRLIEEIVAIEEKIPSWLYTNLHKIREIGNFASHPNKDVHTGMIIESTTEEAEFSLKVLAEMFDFSYVRPKKNKEIAEGVERKKKPKNENLQ